MNEVNKYGDRIKWYFWIRLSLLLKERQKNSQSSKENVPICNSPLIGISDY